MRVAAFIASQTGNTVQLAQMVFESVRRAIPDASLQLYSVQEELAKSGCLYPDYDAYIIGSFVDWYTITKALRDFIPQLPGLKNKPVFAIITHGGGPGTALEDMKALLRQQGANVCAVASLQFSGKSPSGRANLEPEVAKFLTAVK